ncbi:MAG: ACT domain-containing protein [Thermodesulfobacteriaceae bacterium]|nr:ACT domain-containing protein [Thermodesulfobacteriaceae bacterium]
MKIKQISVFLENKKGRLYEVLETLAKANINIRALAIADTSEFGILRMIVNNPDLARETLEKAGFTAKITNVIGVAVKDRPGGLADVLKVLQNRDLNVEYLYAFVGKSEEEAYVVIRTNNLEKTIDSLKEEGFKLIESKTLENL